MQESDLADLLYELVHSFRAPIRAIAGFTAAVAEEASGSLPPEHRRHLERIATNAEQLGYLSECLHRLAQALSPPRTRESFDTNAALLALPIPQASHLRRVQLQVATNGLHLTGWDVRHFHLLIDSLRRYAGELEPRDESARTVHLHCSRTDGEDRIEVLIEPYEPTSPIATPRQRGAPAVELGILRASLRHYPAARLEIQSPYRLTITLSRAAVQAESSALVLPASAAVENNLGHAATTSPEASAVASDYGTRIFLVDDELAEWELMRLIVEDTGLEERLEWHRDSRAALHRLRELASAGPTAWKRLPAAVFVDLRMPLLDGVSFVRKLREEPALEHLPVVILSSSTDPEDIRAAYSAGANAFVSKPTDFQRYAECLQFALAFWGRCNRVAWSEG